MKDEGNYDQRYSSRNNIAELTLCCVHVRQPNLHRLALFVERDTSISASCTRRVNVHKNAHRVSTYLVIEIRLRDARADG
jgi:hypothetical protein